MVDVKKKCTGCAHHVMCMYSDLYNMYCECISDYTHNLGDQSNQVCNVEITCKYYMTNKTVKNDLGVKVPYLMHKEMGIPISECQKAYDIGIEYLRSQGKLKG